MNSRGANLIQRVSEETFLVRESSGGVPTLLRFSWLLFVDAKLA